MEVAEELFFIEKDYESTSINEIIGRVGLAKGTFYHYFRSKRDLLNAILERQLNEFEERVDRLAADSNMGTIEKLDALIGLIFDLRSGNIPELDRMVAYKNQVVQENFIMVGVKRARPLLSRIIREGIEEGLFDTNHPEEALSFIISGSRIITESEQDCTAPQKKLEAVADFAERILGIEPGIFKEILFKRMK
ncbi:MAG: TetR/AcrR family transcriptional regulator [Methanomassiliicoccales archaeon]|nr:TetR/AcrR family transcriptional regulator [Methanomassiliicoccales archaeon]NYT15150.1 TetR/AcrR family transcriptional regulator [Methanomassiliicoccales archaeon]